MGRMVLLSCIIMALAACSGVKSAKVAPVQAEDKKLACADILLEINEAEFFKRKARENRGLSVRNVLMPHTYPSTLISAQDAVGAADERIDYLQNIYTIRHCDKMEKLVEEAEDARFHPQPMPAHAYMPHAMPPVAPQPVMMMPHAMPYGYNTPMMAPMYAIPPAHYGLDHRPR